MNDLTTGLRDAADLIEKHPDLPSPYVTAGSWAVEVNYQLSIETNDLAEQKALAVVIVRAIGGKWDKEDLGETFLYRCQVTPDMKARISLHRDAVCERVVTGTETVTIPAVEAQPERVEEREVVEWRCQPLLAEAVSDA